MASAAAGGGGGSKCYRSLLVTELALRLAAKIESQHPEPRLSYAVGYIFIATWHKSGAVLHGGRVAALLHRIFFHKVKLPRHGHVTV